MDKKYLFKRNNIWWVKVAVPKRYREDLGYDLRQTTGEKDLEKALLVSCLLYTSDAADE